MHVWLRGRVSFIWICLNEVYWLAQNIPNISNNSQINFSYLRYTCDYTVTHAHMRVYIYARECSRVCVCVCMTKNITCTYVCIHISKYVFIYHSICVSDVCTWLCVYLYMFAYVRQGIVWEPKVYCKRK